MLGACNNGWENNDELNPLNILMDDRFFFRS
jgi:hypothetical protein